MRRLARRLECTPALLALVAALAVVNVTLVNWARPLLGPAWPYVMWEGGVLETLTVVQLAAGALVFGACALARGEARARRVWFAAFAAACLVAVGEETNYGRGTLWLDLGAPDFAATYNPQAGTLHNLGPAFLPVLVLFVGAAALRWRHRALAGRLRLPVPRGWLNALLLTAPAVLAMRLDEERYLSVDEVYEWSSSLLLLGLALYYRRGWFLRPAGDPAARRTP